MTASVDIAYMTVEGRGGHGARPQETIDPMPAAAELILALQTIVARNINPADSAVVSCCFVQAGDPLAPTVIPQRVNLSATIRTHSPKVRDKIEARFNEITQGIGTVFGGEVKLDYQRRYPPQINDPALVRAILPALQSVYGEAGVDTKFAPSMGGEDFAFMSEKVPGVYMQVGLGDEGVEVGHRAQLGVHGTVVADRIVGAERAFAPGLPDRIDRHEPHGVDAEVFEERQF